MADQQGCGQAQAAVLAAGEGGQAGGQARCTVWLAQQPVCHLESPPLMLAAGACEHLQADPSRAMRHTQSKNGGVRSLV